jgi:undecaprenyl-diphosphatase
MSIIEALILGILQGLTEFLPVSSSGHLEIGKALLGVEIKDDLLFSVVVHAATSLSTILVFWNDIWRIVRDIFKFEWNESTQYASKIIISMIPVGFVGVLFKKQLELLFDGNILLVGAMLLITGFLLLITHFYQPPKGSSVTFTKAFLVGIAQMIAILPGISRSGATITTSLLIGIDKSEAARFSFLMALIPILGATLLEFKDYWEQPELSADLSGTVLAVGFISAFFVGLLACRWMIRMVKKGKLLYFALYCLLVGTIAIFWKLQTA